MFARSGLITHTKRCDPVYLVALCSGEHGSMGLRGGKPGPVLGESGLGTGTGNSIRGPSAHNDLVGIRPTIGLTSRAGIIPLFAHNDVGGPMARTVADAAAPLNVVAGPDPADPVTQLDADRPRDSRLRWRSAESAGIDQGAGALYAVADGPVFPSHRCQI